MKNLICLIFLSFQATVLIGQGFYETFFQDDDSNIEGILNIHYDNEDTISVVTAILKNPMIIYLYTLDKEGRVIENLTKDTLPLLSPYILDQTENDFTIVSRLNNNSRELRIVSIDTKGNINFEKTTPVFTQTPDQFQIEAHTTNDDYHILSGIMSIENELRSFVIWLDRDYNFVSLLIPDNRFERIGGLATNDTGKLYGVVAFTDNDLPQPLPGFHNTRYYIAQIDQESEIDTITFLTEKISLVGILSSSIFDISHIKEDQFIIGLYYLDDDPSQYILMNYDITNGTKWVQDSIKIRHGFIEGNRSYITNDGNILNLCLTNIHDDVDRDRIGSAISLISKDGDVIWTKRFIRYDENQKIKIDGFGFGFTETSNSFIISGIERISTFKAKPIILKIDKNGCLNESCHIRQVAGTYPKPTNAVSDRNIWYVYNTETNEHYRYTFVDKTIPHINRYLLRSDEMSGDNWYSTGRRFDSGLTLSGASITAEINFIDVPSSILGYDYNFDFDIGDELKLWNTVTAEHTHHILEVIDKDTIEFLDGRARNRLMLECYNPDIEIEPRQVTWIDPIGDPNDAFNTLNACSGGGSEVVTCFYSAGELMWTHPEYGTCAPTGTKEINTAASKNLVYPNPSHDVISLNSDIGPFSIIDVQGNTIFTSNGKKAGERIDISELVGGTYFLFENSMQKGSKVIQFSKL